MPSDSRLAILVGGGPAPGINSAISSATIEAINSGLEVIGIFDGFEHLMLGQREAVRTLTIADVSRVHFDGGSILRTARANPTRTSEDLQQTVQSLRELNVRYLVTIGGDDTAFSASEVARVAGGALRVAHIPKTIDNDIPLPGGMPTFGFETARQLGSQLMQNLMEDSRTSNRWVFVVVMGRTAGHLALRMGLAAGATVTVIPEEFRDERIKMDQVCTILEGAMLKRRAMNRNDGVAIIAEGIGDRLDPEELAKISGVPIEHDPFGHVRLGEIPLAAVIKREVQRRFDSRKDPITITDVTLGYVLRCAPPVPFDIDYTRTLGYGAVRFLLTDPADERLRDGGLVCLDGQRLTTLPFQELRDPVSSRTRVRLVDLQSEYYKVARSYMIRLEQRDLDDEIMLSHLSQIARITPDQFRDKFGPAVSSTPQAAT